MGCAIRDHDMLIASQARRATLQWYADRNQYPANSVKPRMSESVPPGLSWTRVAAAAGATNRRSVGFELRDTQETVPTIVLSVPGRPPAQFRRPQLAFCSPSSAFAYEPQRHSLWLRTPKPNGQPMTLQLDANSGAVMRIFDE